MTSSLQKLGPKPPDHPSIGNRCPACGLAFEKGEHTTLIELGPGGDAAARERARTGRSYNAVCIEVHYACATGEES